MLVSVVVPVYFNSATLPELAERLEAVAERLRPHELELVAVDDGSADDSFAVLQQLAAREPWIRALRLSRNFGSNAAILAGLTYARGDAVVVLTADLQDPPELIPELVAAWEEGSEVVLAARRTRDDPWLSGLLSSIFNRLFRRFVFRDFPRGGFDFLLVSRRVASTLVELGERNSYIFGQVMWIGYSRRVVEYDRGPRGEGRSRWTLGKKAKYFVDAFTAFSYLPIRAASLLGFLLALAGFGYAAVVVVLRLTGAISGAPGFTTLTVLILLAAGIQLIVLGLLGEYLWRVLEESRRRPAFLVESTVNLDPELPAVDSERARLSAPR
jgi:glycosyltransferase involved in cell wall biosynthesis